MNNLTVLHLHFTMTNLFAFWFWATNEPSPVRHLMQNLQKASQGQFKNDSKIKFVPDFSNI